MVGYLTMYKIASWLAIVCYDQSKDDSKIIRVFNKIIRPGIIIFSFVSWYIYEVWLLIGNGKFQHMQRNITEKAVLAIRITALVVFVVIITLNSILQRKRWTALFNDFAAIANKPYYICKNRHLSAYVFYVTVVHILLLINTIYTINTFIHFGHSRVVDLIMLRISSYYEILIVCVICHLIEIFENLYRELRRRLNTVTSCQQALRTRTSTKNQLRNIQILYIDTYKRFEQFNKIFQLPMFFICFNICVQILNVVIELMTAKNNLNYILMILMRLLLNVVSI